MLTLLALWLTLTVAGQEPVPAKVAPSAEQVAGATAELDAALRSRDPKALKTALEAAVEVPHPDVVRRVARALEEVDQEVRLAAIQSLRWLDHPEALVVLHRAVKDRKLTKIPEVAAALLRAIGQHADPRSIEVLAHDPFTPLDTDCVRARIFGLGRIRTKESLDALIGFLSPMGSGANAADRLITPWMKEMRLSLILCSGMDQGESPELWERWWRETKKDFRVPPAAPELPKELRVPWDNFWGLPRRYDRERRREDRGQDPNQPRAERRDFFHASRSSCASPRWPDRHVRAGRG